MNVSYIENGGFFNKVASIVNTQSPHIIIVPNKVYAVELEAVLPSQQKPPILAFEGLDISPVVQGVAINVMERNIVHATICQIIRSAKVLEINEKDIVAFARATIGELPNITGHGINSEDILNNIPAKIATQKEINIQYFVAVWRALNVFLEETKSIAYYEKQSVLLSTLTQHIIKSSSKICAIGDGGKSPIYKKFIQNLLNYEEIKGAIIMHGYDIVHNKIITTTQYSATKVLTPNVTQARQVAVILQYLLGKNGQAKIGILCTDAITKKMIAIEARYCNIVIGQLADDGINSKPLLKLFTILLSGRNVDEILALLQVSPAEKFRILNSIVTGKPSFVAIWEEIMRLCCFNGAILEKIEMVTAFIRNNKGLFFTATADTVGGGIEYAAEYAAEDTVENAFAEMVEFVLSLKKEISRLAEVGIDADYNFFQHFAQSWKVREVYVQHNVEIVSIEEAYLKEYDAIIVTSFAMQRPKGNMIFSEGLRKYYGFSGADYRKIMFECLKSEIFITQNATDFSESVTAELTLKSNIEHALQQVKTQVVIAKHEVPSVISATALETLISKPSDFYLQYIRHLKKPIYTPQPSLDLGNIVHYILENATKTMNFDSNSIAKHFNVYKHRAVFFQNRITQIIQEIARKVGDGVKIESETQVSIEVQVEGIPFKLTAKYDRIDTTPNSITIYDYKSGGDSSFTNAAITKKFEKIQLYIPAVALQSNEKDTIIKYVFLQNTSEPEIQVHITEGLIAGFNESVCNVLKRYFVEQISIDLS